MKNDIIKNDRVVGIKGKFKDKKGFVCRVENNQACVVFKNVWDHGIWVDLDTLKRVKRYKKEQENKNELRIIFREFENEISCIFIDSLPENHVNELTCYARIGQHSMCSIDWLYQDTTPAKSYTELLKELKSIYKEHTFKVLSKLPSRSSLQIDFN